MVIRLFTELKPQAKQYSPDDLRDNREHPCLCEDCDEWKQAMRRATK